MRIFLFTCFLFLSCSAGESVSLVEVGSVTFDVSFLTNYRFRGIFYDQNSNRKLFYFADPVTYKQMEVFNDSGEIVYTTPLNEGINFLYSVEDIQVISRDSIVLFGKQNNKLCLLNHDGLILDRLNINDRLNNAFDSLYIFRTSFGGKSVKNKSVLFHSEFIPNADVYPIIQSYFRESLSHPYFIKIENLFERNEPVYQFGLKAFYENFMSDSLAMGELGTYNFECPFIQLFSLFSDTLYLISCEDLKIQQKIKVKSNFTKIGSTPFELYSPAGPNTGDDYLKHLNKIKYDGHIVHTFYGLNRKYILVVVIWERDPEAQEPVKYSYILYNFQGNKVEEVSIDPERLSGANIFVMNDTIYIGKPQIVNDQKNQNAVSLYKYIIDN